MKKENIVGNYMEKTKVDRGDLRIVLCTCQYEKKSMASTIQ